MKKGQKVRVLADGRVGVVADTHFINWGGKRLVQCQVKFPRAKGDAPWFPIEKLTTELTERTTVVVKGEKGTLNLVYTCNHDNHTSRLEITGEPENLKEHQGTHTAIAGALLLGLKSVYGLKPALETVVEG